MKLLLGISLLLIGIVGVTVTLINIRKKRLSLRFGGFSVLTVCVKLVVLGFYFIQVAV